MSKTPTLEEEFGPAAKFISKHAGRKIDVPEAIISVFEPLEEYGLWNIPWFTWPKSDPYIAKYPYLDKSTPSSLLSIWPDAQADFVKVGWDKWFGKYVAKVGKGPDLTYGANKYETAQFEEFNALAKRVRASSSIEEVTDSDLIQKLCPLYFSGNTESDSSGYNFYEDTLRYGSKSSQKLSEDELDEGPIWKLAHFFTPATELLKVLEEQDQIPDPWVRVSMRRGVGEARVSDERAKYFSKERLIKPIFDKIVECVVAKWGDKRPVKMLIHNKEQTYPAPDGDPNCEICQELRIERAALCEELNQRTTYPDARAAIGLQTHLSKQSLDSTKKWIAQQTTSLKDQQRLQEEFAESIYSPLPATKDRVVEEVVSFVTRLTKLGVSPNKAAETATKLIKLS